VHSCGGAGQVRQWRGVVVLLAPPSEQLCSGSGDGVRRQAGAIDAVPDIDRDPEHHKEEVRAG
jgi:hypothetical protein